MQENQFVDPPYRKKVYKLLSDNFSDFKTTEDDFNKKLDSDPLYATKVFDVLSNNFSDFKRSKDEFISMVSPVKKKDQAAQIGSMVGTDIGSSVLPKVAEVGPVATPREPKTWSSLPWSSWADGSQLPSSSPSVKSKGQRALEKIESLDADFKDFETAYREAPNEFNAWASKTFPTVKLEKLS